MRGGSPLDAEADMLCILVAGTVPAGIAERIVSAFEGAAGRSARKAAERFTGSAPDFGRVSIISTLGALPAGRVLLAGLGRNPKTDAVRFMAGRIVRRAREMDLAGIAVAAPSDAPGGTAGAISEIVEGARLALYSFDRFKSEKRRADPDLAVIADGTAENAAAFKSAGIVADEVTFARDVANMPPNECSPATLAGIGRSMARRRGLAFKSITKAGLRRRGFGGISAVGQGSLNEPRLIILEYDGGESGQRPTVLVGKAVTFDTGGISIKPGSKMDEMKFDKCGGCAVLGIMSAAARLKLPVNLVGIIPSVENMPGSGSYRPGDIVRLYSGRTAEIINTDAEGRLILADAMAYGEKTYSPAAIVDLATLTGACIVALGANVAGMVSNSDELAGRMGRASARTGEETWRLPLNDDYMDMIKSEVADMKNVGADRAAGTITAAAFLRNAIADTPWVHLDIAGTAWTQDATRDRPYNPKGATGFGVRLLLDYLSQ